MIIVENIFEKIVSDLPEAKYNENSIKSFKPVFGFGDDKELINFIKNKGENIYPLIWYIYPSEESHYRQKNKVILRSPEFFIAVPSNDKFINEQRINTTYEKVLIPLYNKFDLLIKGANIINSDEVVEVYKHPFYINEKLPGIRESLKSSEMNKTIAIWDAIKITYKNMHIKNKCYVEQKRFK